MKAITVHQPHATLIALGEKGNETRSWTTKYRGPLAIHAGKKVYKDLCEQEPFKSVLAKHGYTADNLPTGCVVAIANLADCLPIHLDHTGDAVLLDHKGSPVHWIGNGSNEFHFGFYDNGRFAWQLKDINQIPKECQVPVKGQQRLWNWRDVT